MDGRRFDSIVRVFAKSHSRRKFLAALLGGASGVAVASRGVAASAAPCTGSHFECPGQQVCAFNDATQRPECTPAFGRGRDGQRGRFCKGEFEYTWCERGADCCTYPGIRDPGGLQIVTNCCERGVTVCDPERGSVPVA